MIQRVLVATALVAGACMAGCGGPKVEDSRKAEGAGAQPTAGQPAAPAPRESEVVLDRPLTDLEVLSLNVHQLGKLLKKEELAFRVIEAKGWLIAGEAGDLVEKYEKVNPIKIESPLKAEMAPEEVKIRAPGGIRDLDLVSINAKRLALGAATWDEKVVRKNFAKLKSAAGRCLPAAPVVKAQAPVAPAPAGAPQAPAAVPAPEAPEAPKAPETPKAPAEPEAGKVESK